MPTITTGMPDLDKTASSSTETDSNQYPITISTEDRNYEVLPILYVIKDRFEGKLSQPEVSLTRFASHCEFELKGFFDSCHLDPETIKYPRDWWQAFKDRWFPDFLKRIFPIKYQGIVLKGKVIFKEQLERMDGGRPYTIQTTATKLPNL